MLFYSRQDKAILLFHRVHPHRDPMWDPMDPALFADTLKYMQKNFHVITLNELLFDKTIRSSKPLAALTFDDGYRDFIEYSIPIMDKAKVKASMFVVTDCIDKNVPTWTYIMDHVFANSEKMEWNGFDVSSLPEEYHKTSWPDKNEKMDYCRSFKQYIKWISADSREAIINSLLKNFDDVEYPSGMMMSWEEIRQIQSAGFTIGSHSVTHPSLRTIPDNGTITTELKDSSQRIKEETGVVPEIFSYPLGSYDERVKEIAKHVGYKAALAVNYTKYNPAKQDMYEIPRIELYNEGWGKTKMRINGILGYLKKLYR